jgi:ATP-dependent DNA helicase RecG
MEYSAQELFEILNESDECDWIEAKATYNIESEQFRLHSENDSSASESAQSRDDISTPPAELSTPPTELSTPLVLTEEVKQRINALKKREHDKSKVAVIIEEICRQRPVKATEIAELLGRGEDYIKRKYLGDMVKARRLRYLYPEMLNHPEQAYKTKES